MGYEYSIRFSDKNRFDEKKDSIKMMIKEMKSFVEEKSEKEFWIKHPHSENPWDFDIRLFLENNYIFIEVSVFNEAFYEDIKNLYVYLKEKMNAEMFDDNDDIFNFL